MIIRRTQIELLIRYTDIDISVSFRSNGYDTYHCIICGIKSSPFVILVQTNLNMKLDEFD